jgi:hypothetical protein
LVAAGLIQIIAADDWIDHKTVQRDLICALSEHPFEAHLIIPGRWLRTRQDIRLRNLPTVVLYHRSDEAADTLYRDLRLRWCRIPATTPLISVIEEGTYLPSETGRFVDRVPGIVSSAEAALRQLQTTSQEWF